jgi:glycosyltransferase involved in cell wall biosynthesis
LLNGWLKIMETINKQITPTDGRKIDVSVIVCTYNRLEMLRLGLASAASQTTEAKFRYEILVVDDASTDGTAGFIREFEATAEVPVRYIPAPGKGVAQARKIGVNKAAGDWIAFFDDDEVPEPNWLLELLRLAAAQEVDCVGGRILIHFYQVAPIPLPLITRAVLGAYDSGDEPLACSRKTYPGSGNALIHRRIFEAVGNFDESLIRGGEDLDFFRRVRQAGFQAWYAPEAVLYHLTPASRLQEDYLFTTSLRNGENFAVRDYRESGLGQTLLSCMGRMVQAGLILLPRLGLARWRNDGPQIIAQKCLLWRMIGYFRGTLFLLSPRLFAQERFLSRLNFRQQGRNPLTIKD